MGPDAALRALATYLPSYLDKPLNWLSYLIILIVIPILVLIWKPTTLFIRHFSTVLQSLHIFATQGVPQLLKGIQTWGRFLAWNIAFRLIPYKLIFIYFWIIAPLYDSPASLKPRHSCARKGMSLHKDTMVLTDVLHPTQGPFQLAPRGIFNSTAQNRTQDFIIWYLSYIVPPAGFMIDTIFMFHSIGWGINLFGRVLWARLVTKAEELSLLYWPPPEVGKLVMLEKLVVDTELNYRIGTVSTRYSLKSKRTEIRVGHRTVHVLNKNFSVDFLDDSLCERAKSIGNFSFRLWSFVRKMLFNRKTLYGIIYTTIVVVTLSSQTVEAIMSSSLFSFGHENLTAVLDNSATAHIFHDKAMFSNYRVLDPSQSKVATIGEHTCSAHGIGDVKLAWFDDEGTLHKHTLTNALHFPKSSVNLISITSFARTNNDQFISTGGEKAYITTGDGHSKFTWDKFTRNFEHPDSNLPEMPLYPIDQAHSYTTNAKLCDDLCSCTHHQSYSYLSEENSPHVYRVHDSPHVYKDRMKNGKIMNPEDSDDDDDTINRITKPGRKASSKDTSCPPTTTTTINSKSSSVASKRVSWADVVKANKEPSSLSLLQEKFLRWHERCNHLPYAKMLLLSKQGILPKEFLKLENNFPPCGSCLFGRQGRRPKKAKFGSPIRKEEHNYPGGGVSADQIISAQPGLVPQNAGKLTNKRINSVTVFVDHFSSFSYVVLMTECSGKETLRAKQEFEAYAASNGVRISHYHADNGRFQESLFVDDIKLNAQTISFCAVNAHHQNGIVERHNRTLTESARTMLLHAERLWPEAITQMLWPFALKYASHIHNNLSLNSHGKSPSERFLQTSTIGTLDISDFHTFGSPCYVLDPNEHTPKWDPRSSLRIFVGFSAHHARNVAMVLNPYTGLVSPQYHVVFDDHFQTLSGLRGTEIPESWKILCKYNSTDPEATDKRFTLPSEIVESGGDDSVPSVEDSSIGEPIQPLTKSFVNLKTSGLRRSERVRNQASSYFNFINPFHFDTSVFLTESRKSLLNIIQNDDASAPMHYTAFFSAAALKCEEVSVLFDGTLNKVHEFVFAANQQQNETYTFKDAMLQDDASDFIKAMLKEISDHESNSHWTMMRRSSLPRNAKTILSIWSFKRKRSPAGELLKHKARLCAHGGMQKWGENYWETYSPTVSWMSVRALLAVGIIHDLSTSTVDFTLAFPQVDLDIDVFMELPIGCVGPNGDRKGYVLKLNKSLYGLKQASHNWFNYLGEALSNRGFIQSQVDKCVWFKEGIVLLQYVDDLLIVGINDETVANFKKILAEGKENFVFTDGGPLEAYLGVEVSKPNNGSFELKQSFLIEKIIKTIIGDEEILHETNIPAAKELLHKDPDGPERKHDFNYRQAVGMLTYLQGTTRPDISMAVHQCARFSSNPKRSHERAIIKIIRYLKGTKDKGIFISPDKTKGIECFVDASFASGWRPDHPHDASNVLSRTGYLIYYAGCPIHWSSKMQSEIALSTAESEYIALSQAMRETIPFMRFMTELDIIFPIYLPKPKLFCKIFEDNEACISMATSLKFTPRTKHLALKYHHFRSWVHKGFLEVVHVPTTEQLADTLTKPLEYQLFKKFRYQISGW